MSHWPIDVELSYFKMKAINDKVYIVPKFLYILRHELQTNHSLTFCYYNPVIILSFLHWTDELYGTPSFHKPTRRMRKDLDNTGFLPRIKDKQLFKSQGIFWQL